jgi:lactoylglutathione lyase
VKTEISHIGLCVSDLERALAFYCEGLGFVAAESHQIGDEFAPLMELEHVAVRSQFIAQGSVRIELLCFDQPIASVAERRPLPLTGLTHLCIRVTELAAVVERLVALGATVVEGTRTQLPFGDGELNFVYLTDPDGTRIELMDLGS